jgi:hypothetical protein
MPPFTKEKCQHPPGLSLEGKVTSPRIVYGASAKPFAECLLCGAIGQVAKDGWTVTWPGQRPPKEDEDEE